MLYVRRDKHGEIIAIFKQSEDSAQEQLDEKNPEILAFIGQSTKLDESLDESLEQLQQTDIEMIRAIEDLINIFIEKDFIKFQELPKATQLKITTRKSIRDKLKSTDNDDN